MIFRTYEHYDIDKQIINMNKEFNIDCFICYDTIDIAHKMPVKINSQNYYLKNCNCDVFIHITCLDKWYELSQSCPICRSQIIKKQNSYTIIFIYLNNTYNYLQNNILFILRYIFFIISLYYFLSSILTPKQIIYYHHELSELYNES